MKCHIDIDIDIEGLLYNTIDGLLRVLLSPCRHGVTLFCWVHYCPTAHGRRFYEDARYGRDNATTTRFDWVWSVAPYS